MAQPPRDDSATEPTPINQRTRPSANNSPEQVFDAQGKLIAVKIDGQFHSLSRQTVVAVPQQSSTVDEFYRSGSRALIQSEVDAIEQQRERRDRELQELDRDYENEFLGGLRSGITKLKVSTDYHHDRREVNQAQREVWRALNNVRNDNILNVITAQSEIQRIQTQKPVAEYQREIYERDSRFEDDRLHVVPRETRAHEEAMAELAGKQAFDLKKLELDVVLEQHNLEAAESDKNREHEINLQHFGMANQLPTILEELRLLDKQQPTEQVTQAMKVVESAILTIGNMQANLSLTKDERDSLTPLIQDIVQSAIKQAMGVIRRAE